ncbi:MAG: hypothetical protein II799_03085 [Lachnospiraceae bacterium]|nr:hypothetical protein [Lachnospiraceae bacterium]
MLTMLFIIFMIGFVFKSIGLAFKLSWGILKVLFTIVFWPIILIGLVIGGLMQIAFPLLIIAGVVLLVRSISQGEGMSV